MNPAQSTPDGLPEEVNERWRMRDGRVAVVTQRHGAFTGGTVEGSMLPMSWTERKCDGGSRYDLVEQLTEVAASQRHGMSIDEVLMVSALSRCSFIPGTAVKRFVRTMSEHDVAKPMTEKGRSFLWAIAWSYRRQLSAELKQMAERYSGGKGLKDYKG